MTPLFVYALWSNDMRLTVSTILCAATLGVAFPAAAQDAAPAAPVASAEKPEPAKLGPDSTFRQLLDNPKAGAVLQSEIPMIMMALEMGMFPDSATLKQVSESETARTAGGFTAEVYAKILAELSKL